MTLVFGLWGMRKPFDNIYRILIGRNVGIQRCVRMPNCIEWIGPNSPQRLLPLIDTETTSLFGRIKPNVFFSLLILKLKKSFLFDVLSLNYHD